MSGHPSEESLLDLAEGLAGAEVRDHVATCPHCRARADHAREGMLVARDADVPEPSPLYWEAFRRQVGRKIVVEEPVVWRWRLGPALAAAAVLAVALTYHASPVMGPAGGTVESLPAWSALPPSAEDPGLAVLEALAPSERLEPEAGCGGVAECVASLSEEESLALAEILRKEMDRRDL